VRHAFSAIALALLLAAPATAADGLPPLLSDESVATLTIAAPLTELFTHRDGNDDFAVTGRVVYRDPSTGRDAVAEGVSVSMRGHTSRRASECDFPKLKLDLKKATRSDAAWNGITVLKIGTHCGDKPDDALTPKYGRLANEREPWREAMAYRVLRAAGVPTLLARPARITYVDEAGGREPVVRNAMLLEDDDAAADRLDAGDDIGEESFTSAREHFTPEDTARMALAEAMIGNFDWCLRMFPGDIYRCDERHPLWNVLALTREGTRAVPVIYDFDLSGLVVGRHVWFGQVFDTSFVEPPSHVPVEVIAQVQRARTLFDAAMLDGVRASFFAARPAVDAAIARAQVDDRGRELAQQYIVAFYNAIADVAFRMPAIGEGGHRAFADADRASPACGENSEIPAGTPVGPVLEQRGEMSRVRLLDALWKWTATSRCDAIHRQPVWVPTAAIVGGAAR
jgi:hypothetical protein